MTSETQEGELKQPTTNGRKPQLVADRNLYTRTACGAPRASVGLKMTPLATREARQLSIFMTRAGSDEFGAGCEIALIGLASERAVGGKTRAGIPCRTGSVTTIDCRKRGWP